jgi:hypothetical protein
VPGSSLGQDTIMTEDFYGFLQTLQAIAGTDLKYGNNYSIPRPFKLNIYSTI